MRPPYWFCNGWWSPWCVLDVALHGVRKALRRDRCMWVCTKHDEALPWLTPEDRDAMRRAPGRPSLFGGVR